MEGATEVGSAAMMSIVHVYVFEIRSAESQNRDLEWIMLSEDADAEGEEDSRCAGE